MEPQFPYNEDALIALASGDERALDYYIHIHYSPLFYFATSLIHHEPAAQEIASEAFLKLWHYRSKIEDATKVKPFLYRVVRYSCIDYLRREKSRVQSRQLTDRVIASEPNILHKMIEAETGRELFQNLERLPEKCRAVFTLFYLEDKSFKEISEQLGISLNTVKSQKQRAVQLLRSRLGYN